MALIRTPIIIVNVLHILISSTLKCPNVVIYLTMDIRYNWVLYIYIYIYIDR